MTEAGWLELVGILTAGTILIILIVGLGLSVRAGKGDDVARLLHEVCFPIVAIGFIFTIVQMTITEHGDKISDQFWQLAILALGAILGFQSGKSSGNGKSNGNGTATTPTEKDTDGA